MNSKFALSLIATLSIFWFVAGFTSAQHVTYDFIISGGHIVDGTGAPWVAGDIGIVGDRIVAIGPGLDCRSTHRSSLCYPCAHVKPAGALRP